MMTAEAQSTDPVADTLDVSQRPGLDITVAIPTYNGAQRIPRVLERLGQQVDIEGLTWEVIVCDNNSCDRTADVVVDHRHHWPTQYSLRYCFVAEQGAAFARQRAVVEARGKIVAFLDDDNLPAPDWLCHVQQFAHAHPQAGAFGSQIHGDFQGTLPAGFDQIACFLAIVERGSQPHLYDPASKILPPAAGLAVRKSAWMATVPERLFLNHKGKSAGLASEDLEAMLHIQKAGWEIWYNAHMVITHQIPSERLQREYLTTLLRCIGLSRFYIRWLGTQDWQRPFKVPAYIANDLRKLALHYLKHGRRRRNLNTVTACERSLLTNTLISPVFLLRKRLQDLWQNQRDREQLPDRQRWLRRLTDAFEKPQLELYQQEVVSLGATKESAAKGGAVPQFEILLRLRQDSPDQPLVSPTYFFPTAERYGLMRTLDRRIVQQMCRDLAGPGACYSINLSIFSIQDLSFLTFLREQLQRYQVYPGRLWFEMAEADVMGALEDTKAMIKQLKPLGISVVIDGVMGQAELPLFYGATLPVDCLKLSQSCWGAVDRGPLLNWVNLMKKRGIQLVAKGVETSAALEQLQALGISHGQGYQLAKPLPFHPIV